MWWIVIPIYVIIGLWMSQFWYAKFNLELEGTPCSTRLCNHKAGPNGMDKDVLCSDEASKQILVIFQFIIWLPYLLYRGITKPSAEWLAKELTKPRDNV